MSRPFLIIRTTLQKFPSKNTILIYSYHILKFRPQFNHYSLLWWIKKCLWQHYKWINSGDRFITSVVRNTFRLPREWNKLNLKINRICYNANEFFQATEKDENWFFQGQKSMSFVENTETKEIGSDWNSLMKGITFHESICDSAFCPHASSEFCK